LLAQIFKVKPCIGNVVVLEFLLIVRESDFLISILVGKLLLNDGNFGMLLQFLLQPANCTFIVGGDLDIKTFLVFDVEICHILKIIAILHQIDQMKIEQMHRKID